MSFRKAVPKHIPRLQAVTSLSVDRSRSRTALHALICVGLMLALPPPGEASLSSQKVLLVFPYQADLPQTVLAQRALRDELRSVTGLSLEWYYEYLDLNRSPGEKYQQQLADVYAAKYRHKQIDLVFAASKRMLDFWLQFRDDVLPGTPVVFYDILPESLAENELPNDVTGLASKLDHTRILKWVRHMRPTVKEIVVVQGVGRADREFNIPLDVLQTNLGSDMLLTDWSHLSLEEVKQQVRELPSGTVIFYQLMFEDTAGRRYRPIDVLRELIGVAAVPVISKYDQFIGTGSIGGYMYSIEAVAREAARIGGQILHGEAANDIPVRDYPSNRFIFDHSALRRWSIPLSSLPTASLIKNRHYSFWERYRLQLIGLSAGIASLITLAIFLGILTHRLHIARQKLSQFNVNLGIQVEERTVALRQSNRRLEKEITDRKQAEEALCQSEEKFSKAFHSNQVAMALSTFAEGRYLDVNAEFLRLSERSYDEIIGRTAMELHIWADSCQREQVMATLKEDGVLHNLELEVPTTSGKMLFLLWSAERVMIRDTDCVLASAIDITDRKQIERTLQESEARYRRLVENLPDIVYVFSFSRGGIYYSAHTEKVLGYTPEFLYQHPMLWNQSVHPDDKPKITAAIERFRQGEHFNIEYRIKNAEGEWRWLYDRSIGRQEVAEELHIEGLALDITDRKQVEDALQKSTTLLNDIQKISKVGGWEYDLATGQTFWTDEVYRIHDLPVDKFSDSLQQKTAESIVCYLPEDRPVVLECFRQAVEEGRPYDREFRFKTYDGNLKWIHTMGRPIFEDGKVVRVLGTLMDISEQKHNETLLHQAKEAALDAQRAAEAANHAKSEFLATMSHEIRTPMNAILGFAELLDEQMADPKLRSYLASIQSSGKMLLTLINDILDLSKLEAGKMVLQLEPVRLCRLIEDIRQSFSLRASQKDLDLRAECDTDLPEILLLDEVRLRQVLFNLLGNAVKFTEKGSVILTAQTRDTVDDDVFELIITVQDSGIGIPPEEHQQIFEAFQQRAGQRMQQFGGTGLGLAISKRLVDMMSGTITVRSVIGQGSAFEVRLPQVHIAAVDSLHTGGPPHVDLSELQAVVLVADDIASNRQLLTASFEYTGITVITAENGKEALDMVRRHHPDLVLMDLKMPVMNGYDAFRHLQTDPELCRIPVVAITASSLESDIEVTEFAGFLRKPVSKITLFQEICRVLRYHPPHSQPITPSVQTTSSQRLQEFSPDTTSIQPEALTQLEDIFLPRWEQFQTIQPINAVKQFVRDLLVLSGHYHIESVQKYGEELAGEVEYFDIRAMRTTLRKFPDLLASLKSLKQEM